jgi:hypothetical protein
LHRICQFGGGDVVVVASVAVTIKALKVGVEATEKGKDDAGSHIGLTALLTALRQSADPTGKGGGDFGFVLME